MEFLLVYIREAHSTDGWAKEYNRDLPQINDPRTEAERGELAGKACAVLNFDFPAVVDGMDDRAALAYGAWPERIHVVGPDGRMAYVGKVGPAGYWPTRRVREEKQAKARAKGRDNYLLVGAEACVSLEEFLEAYVMGPAAGK